MTSALIQLPNSFAIAVLVCTGAFGDGDKRKKKLEEMGYNYREIQDIVNELLPIIRRCK